MAILGDPGLIELFLIFGITLAIGVWQIVAIGRTLKKTRAANLRRATTSVDEVRR